MKFFGKKKKNNIPSPDEIEKFNRDLRAKDQSWRFRLRSLERNFLKIQDDHWEQDEADLIAAGEIQEPYIHKLEEKI